MKISITFLLFSVLGLQLLMANEGYGQGLRDELVTLEVKGKQLPDVLKQIEEQTDYRFAYNASQIDGYVVDLERGQRNLEETLDLILAGKPIQFKVVKDKFIVLNVVPNRKMSAVVRPLNTSYVGSRILKPTPLDVSGTVTDEEGEPLIGVNIQVKGTNKGSSTDFEGNFTVEDIDENDVLVVSYVGYHTQEVPVTGKSNFSITMVSDSQLLDEVVVVGYGTQKKSSITGAVSTMDGDLVENIPVPNLSNALAGRISGVFVNQASGAPGYAADIRIRSVNTWKGSGNSPLYVIDGVISDKSSFDALDYSEVESLTVLKDAASGAIYGARAANGVILVTTKTGKIGKFRMNYNYSYSFDRPSKIPEFTNAPDMVRLNNYANKVAGQPPFADEQEVAYYNENDPALDYYNLAYRDPVLQKHSLTGSGGSEKVRYFVGASFFDQTSFIKTAGYDKFNVRSNLNINFTDELSGIFKFSYNTGTVERFSFQEDMISTFEANPEFGNLWGRLLYYLPFSRPITSDGHFINPGWIGNPLAFIEEGGRNSETQNNTDFLIGLNYAVPGIKGLSLSSKFSRNLSLRNAKNYEIKPTVYDVVREGTHGLIYTDEIIGSRKTSYPSKEKLAKRQMSNKYYQLNLSAKYANTFGKHNVDALFGYEQSEGLDDIFYGVRENFPLLYKDQFWASGSSRNDSYVDGSEYEFGRASYIGRLEYQYDEKYFLKATLRRDGSMLFAPEYRWGNFPSVSLGWVLTNENFIGESFVDFLKLRASWGLAGNDAVGGWEWSESYSTNGSIVIGEGSLPRVRYNGIVNRELTWEKTSEFNIGLDSRILNSVIFNLEYYNRHNYDILDSRIVSLPSSFGGNLPPINYGIVDGHGVEFEIGYTGNVGKLDYGLTGNLTYSANEVIERDVPENVRDVENPNGRSTDYVAMLVATGIIRTQSELNTFPEGYTIFGKKPALGAINFEDVSGLEPGVPDGKIDNYDRQIIDGKHYLPPYTYGINLTGDWKGIGLDIFFQGAIGVSKLYNDGYGRRFHAGARPPEFWVDSWTPDNIDAQYPQAVPWGYTSDHQASTFWLKKGNYLRLQHLNLHYTFPKNLIQKVKLASVRLFMTGTNLFTISPFDYYDPTVSEIRSYPTMKTFTLGTNVTF